MNKILFSVLLFISFNSYSQKSLNTRVIVTLPDTTGLYEKVRLALVKSDFIVKEDGNRDTLTTYPFNKSTTYVFAYAAIKGNVITFWGFFADTHGNLMGATVLPSKKEYKKIFYFNGDKYWKKHVSITK